MDRRSPSPLRVMAVPGRMEADVLSALRCALLCSAVGLFEAMSVGSAVNGIRGQEVNYYYYYFGP